MKHVFLVLVVMVSIGATVTDVYLTQAALASRYPGSESASVSAPVPMAVPAPAPAWPVAEDSGVPAGVQPSDESILALSPTPARPGAEPVATPVRPQSEPIPTPVRRLSSL